MKLNLKLGVIILSMIFILVLAVDFKKKLDQFHNTYSHITNTIYKLKQNTFIHNSLINESIISLHFNNDKFVNNYKDFLTLKNKIESDQELKTLYPKVNAKLIKILDIQKLLFVKTDDFLQNNSKIKNSLSILYKRLSMVKKYDYIYNENLIRFLTTFMYQQNNLLKDDDLEYELYKYFDSTKSKSHEYLLNFIHIDLLYKELPKLKKAIMDIQSVHIIKELDASLKILQKEAYIQRKKIQSNFYMILLGTIFFFIIIIVLVRDIEISLNKLREKDNFIFRQSKHAALGEMIDAIAHQWKQPIAVIKMRTEFLSLFDKKVTKEGIKEFQEHIYAQLSHMESTLDEFRGFLRPDKTTKLFNVERTIKSVQVLLKDELIKNNILVDTVVNHELYIDGIENEFKHVLINLINNSKDAFEENKIKEKNITIFIDKEQIEIQDNAGGIPSNVIGNIFEANFTTKEEGKGTGIGLYMTKQVLERINAEINVENKNDGACFTIKLKS